MMLSTLQRVIGWYYLLTPMFLVADLFFGVAVRVSLVEPRLRYLYYLVCFGAGILGRLVPRFAPMIGLVESSLNLALLMVGIMLPVFLAPGLDPEVGQMVVANGERLGNFLLAGGMLILGFQASRRGLEGD